MLPWPTFVAHPLGKKCQLGGHEDENEMCIRIRRYESMRRLFFLWSSGVWLERFAVPGNERRRVEWARGLLELRCSGCLHITVPTARDANVTFDGAGTWVCNKYMSRICRLLI